MHHRRLLRTPIQPRTRLSGVLASRAARETQAQVADAQPGGCVRPARHTRRFLGAGLIVVVCGDTSRQTKRTKSCLTGPSFLTPGEPMACALRSDVAREAFRLQIPTMIRSHAFNGLLSFGSADARFIAPTCPCLTALPIVGHTISRGCPVARLFDVRAVR